MMIILRDANALVLRFDKNEEVMEALRAFSAAERIAAGFFTGIGACEEATIAYYDIEQKEYADHRIAERLEIATLAGNIAAMGEDVIIHAHGVLADRALRVYAGHVKKLVVSATCEIALTKLSGRMRRARDNDIGLNLLS